MTTQPSDWAVARAWRELTAPKMTDEGFQEVVGVGVAFLEKRARELDASGGGSPPWFFASPKSDTGITCIKFTHDAAEAAEFRAQGYTQFDAAPRAAETGDTELMDWFSGGTDRFLSQCPTGEWCAQDDVIGAWHGATPREAIRVAMGSLASGYPAEIPALPGSSGPS